MAVHSGYAQINFSKVYYEVGWPLRSYSVASSFDDAYIVAGLLDNKNLLLKIDSEGNAIWNKMIEPSRASDYPKIITLADSTFLLASQTFAQGNSDSRIFCLNFDTNGDTIWSTSISLDSTTLFKSVQQTFDQGFIIVCGMLNDDTQFAKTVIMKLSATGQLLWSKSYSDGMYINTGYSITQTADTGYLVFGMYQGAPPNGAQTFAMKLTPEGEVSWVKKYIMASDVWNKWYEHINVEDGYIFATLDDLRLVLMKTDFSGNVVWAKKYNTYSFDFHVNRLKMLASDDGNLMVLSPDILMKVDANGNAIWARELMMKVADMVNAPDNGFLVVGNGPLLAVKAHDTSDPQIGIIKTDSLGQTFECVFGASISSTDLSITPTSTMVLTENIGTESGEYYVASYIDLTVEDGCVAIIGAVEEEGSENQPQVFPNPANGIIYIRTINSEKISNIKIYSVLGKQVLQYEGLNTEETSVELSQLPKGIYILKILKEGALFTTKVWLY